MQSESTLGQSSRAFGPGSTRVRRLAFAGLIVVAAALAVGLSLGLSGGGSRASSSSSRSSSKSASVKYGSIPDWLPKPTVPTSRPQTASLAHPNLNAIEGATLAVSLPHGSVMVTAVGPSIPSWVTADVEEGKWTDADKAPSTFTITLASAKGTVPLAARALSIITQQGQTVHPRVTDRNGAPIPARVSPGRPVTLTATVGLSEGEGYLIWTPAGHRPLAGWVYQLELD